MKSRTRDGIMGRYRVINYLIALMALAISVVLFKTSVYDSADWKLKADSTMLDVVSLKPDRGSILAADGSPLAVNVRYYEVRMDFRSSTFKEKQFRQKMGSLCDSLPRLVKGTTSAQWRDKFEAELKKPAKERRRNLLISREMTRSELMRLRTFPYYDTIPGYRTLSKVLRTKRMKPYGKMAYRSIGNVLEKEDGWHGSSGLEKALDSLLFGKPGKGKKVQLSNGIRNWAEIPAENGYDIRTTIDVRIQDILETELYEMCMKARPEWATAVIMEVSTGDIKAISNLQWSARSEDYKESVNYAMLRWELGSVMKPISLMIALEDGLARADQHISLEKTFSYAGARAITDSHSIGSYPTVTDILAGSSNIGTAKIITQRFDREPWGFRKRLEDIGFFDRLNVGLAGEIPPMIQELGSADQRFRNEWRVNLSRCCYGYAVQMSPILNLSMINAMANDGKFVRPRLVSEQWRDDSLLKRIPVSYVRERVCRPEVARDMRMMMREVVWSKKERVPTAPKLQNNFVEMAGKTGTAWVYVPGKGYTSMKRLTFTGFFPYEKPLYSCIVVMNAPTQLLGPQNTSGRVAMNVALKLFARGMLGNKSDYRNEADNAPDKPMLLAMEKDNANSLKDALGLRSAQHWRQTDVPDGTVPSVVGMGLREAVAALERKGLSVSAVTGSGYVKEQQPVAGSVLRKGEKVSLILQK